MKISSEGLRFIEESEGIRLTAYLDSVGVLTIGVGHTQGVKAGDGCTKEEADAWLQDDLEDAYQCIEQHVHVDLTQSQFDALCSFVFNLGCQSLRNSTLLNLLNKGDYEGAAKQFARWSHAGGVTLAGLVKRRAAEAELFNA